MTKQECAIVTAYTGITMLQGEDIGIFYKYAEKLIGYPLFTSDFANETLWERLKERSRDDFIRLCAEAVDQI